MPLLTWKETEYGRYAYYVVHVMNGAHVWTFRHIEHDDYEELEIVDPNGYVLSMARRFFETPSKLRAAVEEYVKEYLAPL